ncbi:hypothetical protein V5O48_009582, partial [Marasmius crinis-equi]
MPCPVKVLKNELKNIIEQFWRTSVPDTEAVELLKEYYETDKDYIRQWLEDWEFYSTRNQGHNEDSILPWIQKVKERFPAKGAEGVRLMLSLEYGVKAP